VLPAGADLVAVGYGIAYPFSIIGVTLFVQLMPRLLHHSVPEARRSGSSSRAESSRPAGEALPYHESNFEGCGWPT